MVKRLLSLSVLILGIVMTATAEPFVNAATCQASCGPAYDADSCSEYCQCIAQKSQPLQQCLQSCEGQEDKQSCKNVCWSVLGDETLKDLESCPPPYRKGRQKLEPYSCSFSKPMQECATECSARCAVYKGNLPAYGCCIARCHGRCFDKHCQGPIPSPY